MIERTLDQLFAGCEPHLQLSCGARWLAESDGMRRLCDVLDGASCLFLRTDTPIAVLLAGSFVLQRCASGGWLLRAHDRTSPSYWLPCPAVLRLVSAQGHVLQTQIADWDRFEFDATGVQIQFRPVPENWTLDVAIWRFDDQSYVEELQELAPAETPGYFLLGSHTRYGQPADLYLHLLHGHVYENRLSWPKYRKICSENDAHALYMILSGLKLATGKRLYGLLKVQLLLSVVDRQSENGVWRHGEWTDRMESHFRLHCSAMHMLMDALAEKEDPVVRAALERAAAFLSRQTDELDVGVWFLHDELERSAEAMREGPFRWLPSRALGKSESNMLVLNSHLDATIAVDRYREVTGDTRYRGLVDQAVSATRAVLSLRPAQWLYALVFRAIRMTFLPTPQAERLPLSLRAVKRIAWKYLIPILPRLKARWPRLAMPGGYIERELALLLFAHEYLPINLMDLLRYRRRFRDTSLDEVILAGIALVQDCHLTERWLEVKGMKYTVGFWAEALYQACLAWPDARYRALLAEAVLALERAKLGLPPSLLGANSEAVPLHEQVPTPVLDDDRIKVVNLSRSNTMEILLVNCSGVPVQPSIVRNAPQGLAWAAGPSDEMASDLPQEIVAGGWLWGRGNGSLSVRGCA